MQISDTIIFMDYRFVDILNIDQLEIGDFVEINDEVVSITNISPMRIGYAIEYQNEFGEKDIVDFDDYARFNLFVLD